MTDRTWTIGWGWRISSWGLAWLMVLVLLGCQERAVEETPLEEDTAAVSDSMAELDSEEGGALELQPAPPDPGSLAVGDVATAPDSLSRREGLVVRGVIEFESLRGQYAPAPYLRVVLDGAEEPLQAMTNQSGIFLFEEVSAGRYTLSVTDAKGGQILHRATVSVPPSDTTIILPDIHIERRDRASQEDE